MSHPEKAEEAKKGNDKAFQDLIEEEKNKLYRMAYLYVKNEDDALDIVQETVYKAYISIKKLKDARYFSTWITRILINNALDFIKKNKHVIPIHDVESFHSNENQQIEDYIDLVDAIDRLDARFKSIIILRYYNDFTIEQIAKTLNRPEGTIKTQLHRAVNKLKNLLNVEGI